jgi:hypothetical protein
MNLDSLIVSARNDRPAWTSARTERAIEGTKTRVRRAMIVRRSMVVLGAAAAIFLFVLHGASAPASVGADASSSYGDAGYARD